MLKDVATAELLQRYRDIRRHSEHLCEPLAIEDYGLQAMADASPAKWHLAHTSWFFETFLLKPLFNQYQVFDPAYEYLFNSYYNAVGCQFPRPQRGQLSRPSVEEVYVYRQHVDKHMLELIPELDEKALFKLNLGLNHEQQHQELFLTDHKYNLSINPLNIAYQAPADKPSSTIDTDISFIKFSRGDYFVGYEPEQKTGEEEAAFCFDNEQPKHRVLVNDFSLANRLVNNAEFLAFINNGGYQNPALWLSDGWAWINQEKITAPLYWRSENDQWQEFRLDGWQALEALLPASHISFYEADAFARWLNKRLPTEQEWEIAASLKCVEINQHQPVLFHPAGFQPGGRADPELQQMHSHVWQWTSSPYQPYAGFQPFSDGLAEYNGKFMCNQLVLRGSSCATPAGHKRNSYRNFFYPKDRWQFSGIRLASDE